MPKLKTECRQRQEILDESRGRQQLPHASICDASPRPLKQKAAEQQNAEDDHDCDDYEFYQRHRTPSETAGSLVIVRLRVNTCFVYGSRTVYYCIFLNIISYP